MKRARLIGALSGVGALVLASCGTQLAVADNESPNLSEHRIVGPDGYGKYDTKLVETRITLSDGRELTCVVAMVSSGTGPSCDWQGANR